MPSKWRHPNEPTPLPARNLLLLPPPLLLLPFREYRHTSSEERNQAGGWGCGPADQKEAADPAVDRTKKKETGIINTNENAQTNTWAWGSQPFRKKKSQQLRTSPDLDGTATATAQAPGIAATTDTTTLSAATLADENASTRSVSTNRQSRTEQSCSDDWS